MPADRVVLLTHLVATAFMAGVIVFVQVVHYPLMKRVGRQQFIDYQRGHTSRTGWVVVPAMLAELLTALWLVAMPPSEAAQPWALTGLVLLGTIWASTALLQAPAHRRLADGFDERVHGRLVTTNWLRTVLWVARVPIAVLLAA